MFDRKNEQLQQNIRKLFSQFPTVFMESKSTDENSIFLSYASVPIDREKQFLTELVNCFKVLSPHECVIDSVRDDGDKTLDKTLGIYFTTPESKKYLGLCTTEIEKLKNEYSKTINAPASKPK